MFVAYEVGLDLIRALRPVVKQLRAHNLDIAKQVERAGTSVLHNLGEGSRRMGGDPRRFYAMASGSASEILAALDVAEAWGWHVDSAAAREIFDRERRLLWGLVNSRKRSSRADA